MASGPSSRVAGCRFEAHSQQDACGAENRATAQLPVAPGPVFCLRRRLARLALRVVVPLAVRLHVEGKEHILNTPAIIAANHLSHFDPPLLLHVWPRPLEFVALADLWRSKVAPFLYLYGPISVRRDQFDRQVIQRVLDALAAGQQVAIFPEARISTTGQLEPARPGTAYLALKAGVPVQPVAIWGTENLLTAWKQCRRGEVHVRVGRPLSVPRSAGRPSKAERMALTGRIMEEIARLLPPAYRGVYRERVTTEQGFPAR